MSGAPLVCPACGSARGADERFCPDCAMPLVHADAGEAGRSVSELQERARKIKPQYTEGPLVRVAGARTRPDADLLQGLLLEHGVPSVLQQTSPTAVYMGSAGSDCDVLVAASAVATAREVLLDVDAAPESADDRVRPSRLLTGLLAACVLVAIVLWVGTELVA
jgi:hypothetical protein